MAEIRQQVQQNKGDPFGYFPGDKIGLVKTWESFIDSLLREWKTLNIVFVLLLSAILTILQIDAAASDPVIRYSALLSMVCALMSLLYGCMYIIRFGTMKKAHKAAEWAEEAQSTTTNIIWNVWVLLAMPATWLAWSIILFVTCIAAFIWRTSPGEDPGIRPVSNPLWPRIVLSGILGLGIVYLVLIIATLRRYGDAMDQAWRMRVENWAQSFPYPAPQNDHPYYHNAYKQYDQSGNRGYGTTSMPPVISRSGSDFRSSRAARVYDIISTPTRSPSPSTGTLPPPWLHVIPRSTSNSQGSHVASVHQITSRSTRDPSPTTPTLPPVTPTISIDSLEHSRQDIERGSSDAARASTGPNSQGPSLPDLSGHDDAEPETLHGEFEEVNSSKSDSGADEIYEFQFNGELSIDTILWKYHSEISQAGAIKVYDIGSGLEESLAREEQFNKLWDTSVTKEIFDRVAKDLRHCTEYKNNGDLKEVFDVLKKFNNEIFCPNIAELLSAKNRLGLIQESTSSPATI